VPAVSRHRALLQLFAICGLSVVGSPCKDRGDRVDCRLRRARDASRTKLSREAVRGSGRSAGKVDESAPGSANPWSHPCRAHGAQRKYVRVVKKTSQRADFVFHHCLTRAARGRSVAGAPRTEHRRLMGSRRTAASAAVSRETGRRSHRLGAFLRSFSFSMSSCRDKAIPISICRNLRRNRYRKCLTSAKSASTFPSAPSTERRRLKALPPGSRFGEGRSGELDDGDTDSVHFLGPQGRDPPSGSLPRATPPSAAVDLLKASPVGAATARQSRCAPQRAIPPAVQADGP
jgi:hypothetical protein